MNEADEDLLRAGLFEPPEDFTQRVIDRIAEAPAPRWTPAVGTRRSTAQWLALAGAALWGAVQLATYMFGIWAATSAG